MAPGQTLFGQISVRLGLATETQVAEALAAQAATTPRRPLGLVLHEMGVLGDDGVAEVLREQALARRRAGIDGADLLFGQLVIARGLATTAEVFEACRRQEEAAPRGQVRPLGEYLVEMGALSSRQVERVLERQGRGLLACPACQVRMQTARASSSCPRCGGPLEAPTASGTKFPLLGPAATPGASGPAGGERLGRYRLVRRLGEGGMGVVYLAEQEGLSRPVALKLLLAGDRADPEDVARFRNEAENAARLRHPGIVPIYDVGVEGARHYIAMEYVEGPSLEAALDRAPLTVAEALGIARDVALALHHAHEAGIVHRDVKPGNVLLGRDPEGRFRPMVSDFGLARNVRSSTRLTRTGTAIGTPAYMSPEQACGDKDAASPASDVYSLGATLYEMLCLRPPFEGDTPVLVLQQVVGRDPVSPRRADPRIPRDVETIVLRAMEKEPARRYPSALALAEDLDRFLRDEPIRARPASMAWRIWKRVKRHRGQAVVVAASVLALAALGTWSIRAIGEARDRRVAAEEATRRDRAEQERRDTARGRAEARLAEVKTLHEKATTREDLEAVLAVVDRAIADAEPYGYAPAWFQRGRSRHRLGDLAGALEDYLRALQEEPDHPEALYHAARILLDRDRPEEARPYVERLRDSPRRGVFLGLAQAWTALHTGDLDLAARLARTVTYDAPGLADPHKILGSIYRGDLYQEGADESRDVATSNLDRERAIREMEAYLEREPLDAVAHHLVGTIYLERRDARRALAHMDRAIQLAPSLSGAHYNRVGCLAVMGQPEEALAALDALAVLDPEAHHRLRAMLCFRLVRYDEAQEALDLAMAGRGEHGYLLAMRALLALQRGDRRGFFDDMETWIEASGEGDRILFLLRLVFDSPFRGVFLQGARNPRRVFVLSPGRKLEVVQLERLIQATPPLRAAVERLSSANLFSTEMVQAVGGAVREGADLDEEPLEWKGIRVTATELMDCITYLAERWEELQLLQQRDLYSHDDYCTRAALHYRRGAYDEAEADLLAALELDRHYRLIHYGLATLRARDPQRREAALEALRAAVENGFRRAAYALEDPDWAALHDDPELRRICEEAGE
ncbi:MAG: protein kinase [Planctomycetes bacterium]|nr:protein kinase [Planctomycetota bacterium]